MRSTFIKSITIWIAVIVSLVSIRGYYNEINKEQLRETAEYIETYANDGDMLLFTPSYYMQPFNYYIRNDHLVKKGFPEDGRKDIDEKDINKLWKTVEHYDRVWLILSDAGDKKEVITKTLLKSYNISYYKEYKFIKIYLFEKGSGKTA